MNIEALLQTYSPSAHMEGDKYLKYENYFRGTDESLARRKEELADLVANAGSLRPGAINAWLDIASGNGLMLDVLNELSISAFGVEMDIGLAADSAKRGHQVFCGEAIEILKVLAKQGAKFDVISCLHLIEHMSSDRAEQLIKEISNLLSEGGLMIMVTPNSKDMRVMLGSFYRDPTHIRPYPIELLDFYCENNNLDVVFKGCYDRFTGDVKIEPDCIKKTSDALGRAGRIIKKFNRAIYEKQS